MYSVKAVTLMMRGSQLLSRGRRLRLRRGSVLLDLLQCYRGRTAGLGGGGGVLMVVLPAVGGGVGVVVLPGVVAGTG